VQGKTGTHRHLVRIGEKQRGKSLKVSYTEAEKMLKNSRSLGAVQIEGGEPKGRWLNQWKRTLASQEKKKHGTDEAEETETARRLTGGGD